MGKNAEIQAKVAEVITQRAIPVRIGRKVYRCAPPCLGTLIRVSEMVANFPVADEKGNETLLGFALSKARYCGALPNIYAMLVLGSKGYDKRTLFGLGRKRGEELARVIADEVTPADCRKNVERLLYGIQVKDFFELTTFLKGVEITKPTKVVTGATASGRP